MIKSSLTTFASPLTKILPSVFALMVTSTPATVVNFAPSIKRGEYATNPSMTCASTRLPSWEAERLQLELRAVRKAALSGAKTVMEGVESREEFEEARSLANVVVSGVEKRVSERGLGMVKKLRNR
jgi:hypothetical protein